jgi:hypothetical protein
MSYKRQSIDEDLGGYRNTLINDRLLKGMTSGGYFTLSHSQEVSR